MRFLILLFFAQNLWAQSLPPVRTATIFKNGKSLIFKSGKVATPGGNFSTTKLPDALFGTFWAAGPELASVFAHQDSLVRVDSVFDQNDFFRSNLGKSGRFWLDQGKEIVEGKILRVTGGVYNTLLLLQTSNGKWMQVTTGSIARSEFAEQPVFEGLRKIKVAENRFSVQFKTARTEQDLALTYLTNQLGWTPIYRLDLLDKKLGRLALQAEISNDAEDLGEAELRLAVGVPNFKYADRPTNLFRFGAELFDRYNRDYSRDFQQNAQLSNRYVAYESSAHNLEESVTTGIEFEGSQAEDYFFYAVRPGNFPKNSRYLMPVFETEIAPTHFFQCDLPPAGPSSITAYRNASQLRDEQHEVAHFVEFQNNTKFPWTAGAANITAKTADGQQPLSQDRLPYTAPGAKCKVKIAVTPEVKVTHAEGDIEQEANAKQYFNRLYDRVKIEAQVSVVNHKSEPMTLRIRRIVEGTPGKSELGWTTTQEQATLRVNPSFTVEWELELKPGEERKWKYTYDVLVDL